MEKRGLNDAATDNFTESITIASYFSKCHELYSAIWGRCVHTNKLGNAEGDRRLNDVADHCRSFRANFALYDIQYCEAD